MKMITWDDKDMGVTHNLSEIPDALLAESTKWRESMVEAAAEASEELMDEYLESGELAEEQIYQGLRLRTLAGEIVPALCGSAFKNKGVQPMLDSIVHLCHHRLMFLLCRD